MRRGALSDDRASPLEGRLLSCRFYVYVLLLSNNDLYVGYTTDLKRRIPEHERGGVQSTRFKLPVELIHCEAYALETDARRRERFLKTTEGKRLLRQQIRDILVGKGIIPR